MKSSSPETRSRDGGRASLCQILLSEPLDTDKLPFGPSGNEPRGITSPNLPGLRAWRSSISVIGIGR
jgi:hypothetical protein